MSFLADKRPQACTGSDPAQDPVCGPLLPLHPPGNTQRWEQGSAALAS